MIMIMMFMYVYDAINVYVHDAIIILMIYNSHSCVVNALRCSFPYRSGNILTVGGLLESETDISWISDPGPGRLGHPTLLL